MPLKLTNKKSYTPWKIENVARVKRDEAIARGEEEEKDRRLTLADSEARLDRMRTKSRKKRDREDDDEGEKQLERQLKRLPDPSDEPTNNSVIIRPSTSVPQHINFWSELEAGSSGTAGGEGRLANLAALDPKALQKATEKQKLEDLTRTYIAKKGEGQPMGWYASMDGKSDKERKETAEASLERAYKDGESKRLSDPLALMNSYLQRRTDVLTGKHARDQKTYHPSGREWDRNSTATPETSRGNLTPIEPKLLGPKRRRGDPIPPPPEPEMPPPKSVAKHQDRSVAEEASSRVSSERARALALIAAKKRERERENASSLASDTPRSSISEWGAASGGFGMFNRDETRDAHARWNNDKRSREEDSWHDRKRRRDDRERESWGRDRRRETY